MKNSDLDSKEKILALLILGIFIAPVLVTAAYNLTAEAVGRSLGVVVALAYATLPILIWRETRATRTATEKLLAIAEGKQTTPAIPARGAPTATVDEKTGRRVYEIGASA